MSEVLKLLMIDDDEVDRLALRRALGKTEFAFELSEAADGPTGLDEMRAHDFDCVFLDFHLPPLDGIGILREIHALSIEIPVIILTGQGDERLVADVMREGAADYLGKASLTPEAVSRSLRHVTRVHKADQALKWLASFPELSPTPTFEIDGSGQITYLNPAAKRTFVDLMQNGVDHPALTDWEGIRVSLLEGSRSSMMRDIEIRGSFFHQVISQVAGRPLLRFYSIDTTERRRAEQQLRHSAFYDVLTDLPNRALFIDRLGQAIEHSRRRADQIFAVLFLDLDRFKVVNDSLGHHRGDQLLILAAERLQKCVRGEDTVARFGGDEFAILIENPEDTAEVTRIAGRIQIEFERSITLDGRKVYTTSSIGIALGRGGEEKSAEDYIREADTAMYRAKASGGSSFQVFDRGMHDQAINKLQMETDLRSAIDQGQLRIVFQPIVALDTGALAGFEALVRWDHPVRGTLLPDDFLALAEEIGIVLEIDRWVISSASEHFIAWRKDFADAKFLSLSVNVSKRQFSDGGLPERVRSALGGNCSLADGFQLCLDVTEAAMIDNLDLAIDSLTELKAFGVKLAMDDFGTGYSSLSYLRRLPIDIVKIDRSIISQFLLGDDHLNVVRGMIALARNLGLQVIAEGVEREDQYHEVVQLQCDFAQGHWFSEPLDAKEARRLIASGQKWRNTASPNS